MLRKGFKRTQRKPKAMVLHGTHRNQTQLKDYESDLVLKSGPYERLESKVRVLIWRLV